MKTECYECVPTSQNFSMFYAHASLLTLKMWLMENQLALAVLIRSIYYTNLTVKQQESRFCECLVNQPPVFGFQMLPSSKQGL